MPTPEKYRGTNIMVFNSSIHLSPEDALIQNNFKALADLLLSVQTGGNSTDTLKSVLAAANIDWRTVTPLTPDNVYVAILNSIQPS